MADYRYFAYGRTTTNAYPLGRWVLITETDDYDEAASIANKWDERMDVHFFDRRRMTFWDYQTIADIKFDNAIAKLSLGA